MSGQFPLAGRYGKSKVRVAKAVKTTERHTIHDMTVEVLLGGPGAANSSRLQQRATRQFQLRVAGASFDCIAFFFCAAFAPSFEKGDNSVIVPTDTIKNTCYIIAKNTDFDSIGAY